MRNRRRSTEQWAVNDVTVRRPHAHLFSSGVTSPLIVARECRENRDRHRDDAYGARRRAEIESYPSHLPVRPARRRPDPADRVTSGCEHLSRSGTDWHQFGRRRVGYAVRRCCPIWERTYFDLIAFGVYKSNLNVEFKRQTLYSKTGQRGVQKYHFATENEKI